MGFVSLVRASGEIYFFLRHAIEKNLQQISDVRIAGRFPIRRRLNQDALQKAAG